MAVMAAVGAFVSVGTVEEHADVSEVFRDLTVCVDLVDGRPLAEGSACES